MNNDFIHIKNGEYYIHKYSLYRDKVTGHTVEWFDDDTVYVQRDPLDDSGHRLHVEQLVICDRSKYEYHYQRLRGRVEGAAISGNTDNLHLDIDSVIYRFYKQVVGFRNLN